MKWIDLPKGDSVCGVRSGRGHIDYLLELENQSLSKRRSISAAKTMLLPIAPKSNKMDRIACRKSLSKTAFVNMTRYRRPATNDFGETFAKPALERSAGAAAMEGELPFSGLKTRRQRGICRCDRQTQGSAGIQRTAGRAS
jgi:hypothetical protein